MQVEVRVEFLKQRWYRGVEYNAGDVAEIYNHEVQAYLDCKVVKVLGPDKNKKIIIDYEKLNYKRLQLICKQRNIQAVGKRNDLIASLIDFDSKVS